VLAAAATAGITVAGRGHDHHGGDGHHRYAIGLWGDLPYSTGNSDPTLLQKTVGVPSPIADMNRQHLALRTRAELVLFALAHGLVGPS
jgi:hypothetical protein